MALGGLRNKAVEVRERSICRLDTRVVGHVISEVDLRRWIERSDPDRIHTEIGQIVEMDDDALQIADAVPIRIRETARVDLIDDGVLPPVEIAVRSRTGMLCRAR